MQFRLDGARLRVTKRIDHALAADAIDFVARHGLQTTYAAVHDHVKVDRVCAREFMLDASEGLLELRSRTGLIRAQPASDEGAVGTCRRPIELVSAGDVHVNTGDGTPVLVDHAASGGCAARQRELDVPFNDAFLDVHPEGLSLKDRPVTQAELFGASAAYLAIHEAGHIFGAYHTDIPRDGFFRPDATLLAPEIGAAIGPDFVVGTDDDLDVGCYVDASLSLEF